MAQGLNYACGRCRKIIPHSSWTVVVRPDGKLSFTAQCHGERHTFIGIYDAGGVLFTGKDVMELDTRDPDYWRHV
jgi:hypothetical protein